MKQTAPGDRLSSSVSYERGTFVRVPGNYGNLSLGPGAGSFAAHHNEAGFLGLQLVSVDCHHCCAAEPRGHPHPPRGLGERGTEVGVSLCAGGSAGTDQPHEATPGDSEGVQGGEAPALLRLGGAAGSPC